MTFAVPAGQTPVEGEYAVARFASGGALLGGWTLTLNGSPSLTETVGKYSLSVRRDGTGVWLRVSEIKALVLIVK